MCMYSFLESFNSERNGFASVIKESQCKNVVLGHIGNYGYSVFERDKYGYFKNICQFSKNIGDIEPLFIARKDGSGMLPLDEKLKLISDSKIKELLIFKIREAKARMQSFEKWRAISGSKRLEYLTSLSKNELESLAASHLDSD
jgi:hypothetical protein